MTVVERRAARRGVCCLAPLAADLGPGPEAVAEDRAAGPRICFSAPFADFGAVVEGRALGQGICFSVPVSSNFHVFFCAAWWRARSWSCSAAPYWTRSPSFLPAGGDCFTTSLHWAKP